MYLIWHFSALWLSNTFEHGLHVSSEWWDPITRETVFSTYKMLFVLYSFQSSFPIKYLCCWRHQLIFSMRRINFTISKFIYIFNTVYHFHFPTLFQNVLTVSSHSGRSSEGSSVGCWDVSPSGSICSMPERSKGWNRWNRIIEEINLGNTVEEQRPRRAENYGCKLLPCGTPHYVISETKNLPNK